MNVTFSLIDLIAAALVGVLAGVALALSFLSIERLTSKDTTP